MSLERIILLKADITEIDCDAIVNAANTELWLGSGVAGAILAKGGKSIEDEAVKKGPIELGEAVITKGGTLKASYVIHAAAMHPGDVATVNTIAKATRHAMNIVLDKQLKSVAFPAIGTGVGGVSFNHCAREMISEISKALDENTIVRTVYIVLFSPEAYDAFKMVFDNFESSD